MLEVSLKIIDTIAQVALVFISLAALFIWKVEMRRKEKYQFAKELLDYIQNLRFIIHAPGSVHQIYINDLILSRDEFFNKQLSLIGNSKLYFDETIFGLFSNLTLRSNIFIPKHLRTSLEELTPVFLKKAKIERRDCTYLQIDGARKDTKIITEEDLYTFPEDFSVLTYFQKWEHLISKLNRDI